jgi:hypothetical protein
VDKVERERIFSLISGGRGISALAATPRANPIALSASPATRD